jgi:hypothetical protein
MSIKSLSCQSLSKKQGKTTNQLLNGKTVIDSAATYATSFQGKISVPTFHKLQSSKQLNYQKAL